MKLAHKYILVDDINIHYVESDQQAEQKSSQDCAKKPLTTIMFLHGFPEYWGTWRKQLDFFSTEYRVVAPDLPGYNLSDKPSDTDFYRVPNLIAFMAKFIAAINPAEPIILVAHDWGGAIAWPLAAFHPDLISKLIILNAAHPSTFTREMINNPIQRKKSAYIHELISPSGESLLSQDNYQYLTEKIMVSSNSDVFTDAVQAQYRRVWRQEGAINGMLQYYRAMPQLAANESVNAKLADESKQVNNGSQVMKTADIKIPNINIHIPTLILWGEQDLAFVNENLDDIHRYVTHCTIKRFVNTSHWLQHERPDEVNIAIDTFITQATINLK